MMKPRICLEWGPNDIEHLRDLVSDLKQSIESAPCLVAHEGEFTYECRHDALCRVCRWRTETLQLLEAHEARRSS